MYEIFCGVEFLCHEDAPNWLGWIVIVVGSIALWWVFCGVIVLMANSYHNDRYQERLRKEAAEEQEAD